MRSHPVVLAAVVILVACSSGTGPDGGGTEGKTHPSGVASDKIAFNAGLIGLAVSPRGVGYVTTGLGTIGAFSTTAPYGQLSPTSAAANPRDLVLDRAGTTAYVVMEMARCTSSTSSPAW
jgi:hypothetical protein